MKYGSAKNLFLLFCCLFVSAAYADVTVKRGELVCAYRYDVEKKKLVWEKVECLPMRAFGPIVLIDKPERGIKFFKKGKFNIKIEGQVKDCIPKIAGFKVGKI